MKGIGCLLLSSYQAVLGVLEDGGWSMTLKEYSRLGRQEARSDRQLRRKETQSDADAVQMQMRIGTKDSIFVSSAV
jgi:hypothetical protein